MVRKWHCSEEGVCSDHEIILEFMKLFSGNETSNTADSEYQGI